MNIQAAKAAAESQMLLRRQMLIAEKACELLLDRRFALGPEGYPECGDDRIVSKGGSVAVTSFFS
jgi:hypothetical protein